MNLFDLRISIVWFFLSFVILPFAGFIFRSIQLQKKERRIKDLEEEMVTSHAEILALQAQLAIRKDDSIRTMAIEGSRQFAKNASKGKLKVSTM
ncbi:hypothetical protein [Pinibacter aurantiacus]|uniref:Uncharacterized protein n=1 Tax=Pinibacter aurantiacus TaxID=2851599 RepID=A0A9E2SAF4_9BACT|nr:hypothetical protein [Pinibacter aurantiacus]MBV4357682.1 hypothetical protein [Pinibacter aurantiacus]